MTSREPRDSGEQMGTSIGVSLERIERKVQTQARDLVHDTSKSFGGHHSCRFHEWQRDAVE